MKGKIDSSCGATHYDIQHLITLYRCTSQQQSSCIVWNSRTIDNLNTASASTPITGSNVCGYYFRTRGQAWFYNDSTGGWDHTSGLLSSNFKKYC